MAEIGTAWTLLELGAAETRLDALRCSSPVSAPLSSSISLCARLFPSRPILLAQLSFENFTLNLHAEMVHQFLKSYLSRKFIEKKEVKAKRD